MINLQNKRVMVTGGTSMIGRAIINALHYRNAITDSVPHNECDILYLDQIRDRINYFNPDYIILAAGFNGGLSFNKSFPADIFLKSSQIALNTLHAALEFGINKCVSIIPSCAYSAFNHDGTPRDTLKEKDFLDGICHPSVACHGNAKRILFNYSENISKQFNLNYVCCVLNNSYGPYDSFDVNKTKVIGGLIQKFVRAKREGLPSVEVWSEGSARREFIFCGDAGDGIVRTLESYDDPSLPLNIGNGIDYEIRQLAKLIRDLVDWNIEINFDTTKPNGQLKKLFDNTRMRQILNWEPKTGLINGLMQTIKWYEENYQ